MAPVELSVRSGSATRVIRYENRSLHPAEIQLAVNPPAHPGDSSDVPPLSASLEATPLDSGRRGHPPHVFIYLIDTLRADAVLGNDAAKRAPAIQAFARDAVLFEDAWAPSSWTLPTVVSLLTGARAGRHGIWRLDQRFPADGLTTITEMLSQRGYFSAGFSQSWVAGPVYGIDRGFDSFYVSEQVNGAELRTGDLLTLLRAWLLGQAPAETPLFVYLHSVEPHAPYAPRPGDAEVGETIDPANRLENPLWMQQLRSLGSSLTESELEYARSLYLGEVHFADRYFGRFLELLRALDLYDDSLVILLSDHGEEFREHGAFGHGRTLYEEVTRVPLVIRFPHGRWSGLTTASPVSLLDLAPTILDLAGWKGQRGVELDGESLLRVLGRDQSNRRGIVAEVVTKKERNPELGGPRLWRSLLLEDVRCVHITSAELEDGYGTPERWIFLRRQPELGSEVEIAADGPDADLCREALLRFEATPVDQGAIPELELAPDQIEALRSLGYLK